MAVSQITERLLTRGRIKTEPRGRKAATLRAMRGVVEGLSDSAK